MARDQSLDMDAARERFDASADFTVAFEEEFALIDPATLDLVHRFDELHAVSLEDSVLADSVKGELIDTEIEIRSGKGEGFADAIDRQCERRRRLFDLAERLGIGLVAMGTHPWADYREQRIIDTPHYQRLRHDLGWVAQRNNTWSLHAHVGVRGADRAIAVCDRLRGMLPTLLALSASSPLLEGHDTGLHSVRTQIFTRTFPRCGIPEAFRSWASYAKFIGLLERTGSVVESTQLWWSIRPHHRFATVEVRICDAQPRGDESFRVAALIVACVAQAAIDYDEGIRPEPLRDREIEENLWRAIRHGMDGRLIDFEREVEIEAAAAVEDLVEWTTPAREALGLDDPSPPGPNGAQRVREMLRSGRSIDEVYRAVVEETESSYVPECVPG